MSGILKKYILIFIIGVIFGGGSVFIINNSREKARIKRENDFFNKIYMEETQKTKDIKFGYPNENIEYRIDA